MRGGSRDEVLERKPGVVARVLLHSKPCVGFGSHETERIAKLCEVLKDLRRSAFLSFINRCFNKPCLFSIAVIRHHYPRRSSFRKHGLPSALDGRTAFAQLSRSASVCYEC